MTTKPIDDKMNKERVRDQDLIKAEMAMQRAARKAREKALRIGAGVIIIKDGKIVEECPEQAD